MERLTLAEFEARFLARSEPQQQLSSLWEAAVAHRTAAEEGEDEAGPAVEQTLVCFAEADDPVGKHLIGELQAVAEDLPLRCVAVVEKFFAPARLPELVYPGFLPATLLFVGRTPVVLQRPACRPGHALFGPLTREQLQDLASFAAQHPQETVLPCDL